MSKSINKYLVSVLIVSSIGLISMTATAKKLTPLNQAYYDHQQLTCWDGCSMSVLGQTKQLDFCWCYCADEASDIKQVAQQHHAQYEEQMKPYWAQTMPSNEEIQECVRISGI